MRDLRLAIIIASLHGRTGKTLLARIVAEYLFLSGEQPAIFDTDPIDHDLGTLFPAAAQVVDLAQVLQQMRLFDTLVKPSPNSRLVDLSHRSFVRFFDLMDDTDFVPEAHAKRIEPVILYIPDHRRDSFEAGLALARRFPDCAFVVVENAHLARPTGLTRRSDAYRALEHLSRRFAMPALAPEITKALEEPSLPLRDFMRRPQSYANTARLPEDLRRARTQLRSWLVALMREVHRMMVAATDHARTRPDAGACP